MNDTHEAGREALEKHVRQFVRASVAFGQGDVYGNVPPLEPDFSIPEIMKASEAYARDYAVRELEKLPTLIARIKDQENTPEYLVVDAREITRAIARLNGEHDQPNN